MVKKYCPYCNEKNMKKLLVREKLGMRAIHNLFPTCRGHLTIILREHRIREFTDITDSLLEDLFDILKELIGFFHSENTLIFWYQGMGKTLEHFHIHFLPMIPPTFWRAVLDRENRQYKVISPVVFPFRVIRDIAELNSDEAISLLRRVRQQQKDLAITSPDGVTSIWVQRKGWDRTLSCFNLFPREKGDNLIQARSQEEKAAGPNKETVYSWVKELKSEIAKKNRLFDRDQFGPGGEVL